MITKEVKKGLSYKGGLRVVKDSFLPFENDTLSLSNANSYTINLHDLKLNRRRIMARVFGQIIDASTNKPLADSDITLSVDSDQKIEPVRSDSNGAFDISFEIRDGYPILASLTVSKTDTNGASIPTILLNTDNKYTHDCGKVQVNRNEVDISVSGTVVDAVLIKNIEKARVSLFLGGAPLKEVPENTNVYTVAVGAFVFKGKGYIGLEYRYSMEIKKDYFHEFYSYGNVLNRENNYKFDFGRIDLARKTLKLTINGQVYSFDSKNQLQGATVDLVVERPDTQPLVVNQESSAIGEFLFNLDGYEEFEYKCSIVISKPGYTDEYRKSFTLNLANEYSINLGKIELARSLKTMLVTGVVLDKDNRKPIVKAEISLGFALPSETFTSIVSTDASGKFRVEQKVTAINTVPVVIIVIAPNYHETRRSITLEPSNHYSTNVEILLRKEGIVEPLLKKKQIIRGRVIAKYECPQLPNNEVPLNGVLCEFYVADQFNAGKLYHVSTSSTTTDMFGMFDMQAPLNWEANKEDPSSYQAFVILKHKGFQIDKIEVLLGGRTWRNEINLGTVRVNHSKFGDLPCPAV